MLSENYKNSTSGGSRKHAQLYFNSQAGDLNSKVGILNLPEGHAVLLSLLLQLYLIIVIVQIF